MPDAPNIDDRLTGDWATYLDLNRVSAFLMVAIVATAVVVIAFTRRALEADGRRRRTVTSMTALTLCSSLVVVGGRDAVVLAGWLGSGWALLSLLGGRERRAVAARRSAAISLSLGDAAFAAAIALLALDRPDAVFDDMAAVLIVVAGLSRSALVPFHRWLVGTITAPTPVSAVVHAGLVSGAGLLLLRYRDLFVASTVAVALATLSALATIVVAGRIGGIRPDAKGTLAWSTVAQMAVMVLQCCVGAFSSAALHIAGHGMYKAARFLGVAGTVGEAAIDRRTAPASVRRMTSLHAAGAATVSVGVASAVVPPDLVPAGRLLVVVLAWASVFAAARGWLARSPVGRPALTVLVGSVVVAMAYFAGLRLVEAFLKPDLPPLETSIGPGLLAVLVGAVVAIGVAAPTDVHRSRGVRSPRTVPVLDDVERSRLRGDVTIAAQAVAPQWPLSSFVAVNPLGGLEALGFNEATSRARRWTGGRTHLTLTDYRVDHAAGVTRLADLEYAVHARLPDVAARPPVKVDGRLVDPVQIVALDLLHGPDEPTPRKEPTELERRGLHDAAAAVDTVVAHLAGRFVVGGRGDFVATALPSVLTDTRIRRFLDGEAVDWLAAVGDDPPTVVHAAAVRLGLEADDRVDEFRRQLLRLPGWAGHAKWRTEWAPSGETGAVFGPIDLLAVRMALEAAIAGSAPRTTVDGVQVDTTDADLLDERVEAVAARLAPGRRSDDLTTIRSVLGAVPGEVRSSLWLAAQERAFDEQLLTVLGRVDPGRPTERPDAQAVFCIDVRSERFRRHLEEFGGVETIGFAGFFGLPVDVRRIDWARPEPRCPVLVRPAMTVTEHLDPISHGPVSQRLQHARHRAALRGAHDAAKKAFGAQFALAEALGWITGPIAAWRTFRPGSSTAPPTRPTRLLLDARVLVEQKVFAAESILRTMGLIDGFAPLVLLCGHTSRTTNNAHAAALDCGACGGASGEDNALAVAGLLNSPDVRHGLLARGIEIPDDTWFVAGVHDTTSDRVTLLDAELVPIDHTEVLDRLGAALAAAGAATAVERSRSLPGRASTVRHRGADWAQIRPEWGLAGAAAFVIAPRSSTAGLDLDGRAFLHEYDSTTDLDGAVLETIMTAPLIVAHWITSQYYFSTVDPEVFGAGDKLIHNPVGRIGVLSGDGGDLRVGLPLQSTHVDGRRHHQPLRLLAVVQADLETIERIIARHRILQNLVTGSWIRLAARSLPHEPWSIRTAAGTWLTHPRPVGTVTTMARQDLFPATGRGG